MTKEVPKYFELMMPVVRALDALGGSGSREEIRDRIVGDLKLPAVVADLTTNGGASTILDMRISWALSYLKAGGALDNSERGVWALSERGKSLTDADIQNIIRDYRAAAAQRRREREADQPLDEASGDNDAPLDHEDVLDWEGSLLRTLGEMPSEGFERLCQRLLRENDFQKVEVTGKSGDGGIDGYGELVVNLISFRVVFQAKRWKGSVGSKEIRDFRGAMSGRDVRGLFITTGTFTGDAQKEATRDGPRAGRAN